MAKEKKKKSITAFSILFIILIALTLASVLFQGSSFEPITVENADGEEVQISETKAAKLSDLVMAPFNGFKDAIEISVFILVLGGFLGIVQETGALEAGIDHLVRKLEGNELKLILILMILFSIGGSTYGMAEETVAFYALITSTMVAAGFDTIVAVGTILLGSGAGVLGSTVNPFATGVAMDALTSVGIEPNNAVILAVGAILWISTAIICISTVMKYAKQVKADKGSTILSQQEQKDMIEHYGSDDGKVLEYTSEHKTILGIFAFAFIVMVISLIPWGEFGLTFFDGWTSVLTGNNFGDWYFGDLAMWFFIMGIIIGIVAKMSEKEIVDTFMFGSQDILSVVLIIVVARGASVIMQATHLDTLILDRASKALASLSPIAFVPAAYVLYLFLSFLIPSTSGLAYVSIPVMGGLAHGIGLSPDVMVAIFCAGCGIMNMITPTSGVVMGGLEIAKVDYSTWVKFMKKPIIIIAITNIIILTGAMLLV